MRGGPHRYSCSGRNNSCLYGRPFCSGFLCRFEQKERALGNPLCAHSPSFGSPGGLSAPHASLHTLGIHYPVPPWYTPPPWVHHPHAVCCRGPGPWAQGRPWAQPGITWYICLPTSHPVYMPPYHPGYIHHLGTPWVYTPPWVHPGIHLPYVHPWVYTTLYTRWAEKRPWAQSGD